MPLPDEALAVAHPVLREVPLERRTRGTGGPAFPAVDAEVSLDRRFRPRLPAAEPAPEAGAEPAETADAGGEPAFVSAIKAAVTSRLPRLGDRARELREAAELLETEGDANLAFEALAASLLEDPLDAAPVRDLERLAATLGNRRRLADAYEELLFRRPDHPSTGSLRRRISSLRQLADELGESEQPATPFVAPERTARAAINSALSPLVEAGLKLGRNLPLPSLASARPLGPASHTEVPIARPAPADLPVAAIDLAEEPVGNTDEEPVATAEDSGAEEQREAPRLAALELTLRDRPFLRGTDPSAEPLGVTPGPFAHLRAESFAPPPPPPESGPLADEPEWSRGETSGGRTHRALVVPLELGPIAPANIARPAALADHRLSFHDESEEEDELAADPADHRLSFHDDADEEDFDDRPSYHRPSFHPDEPVPAPFLRRCASWAIDGTLLLGVPPAILLLGTSELAAPGLGALDHLLALAGRNLFAAVLLTGLIAFVYLTLGAAFGGRTLGGWLTGLRAVDLESGGPVDLGRAATRAAVALVGTLAFLAGPLWALFDPRGQALHDKAAGTVTVHSWR